MDRSNTPSLDARIDRVNIEAVNLDLASANELWATIGSRYAPHSSAKIRVRQVSEAQIGITQTGPVQIRT